MKADRQRNVLMVPGAFSERGVDEKRVVSELADELLLMASWLGLESVEVGEKGDLASRLRKQLSARR